MDAEPTEDLGNPSLDQERAAKLGEEIQTVKHISGNTCRFGLWLIRFEHLVPSITSKLLGQPLLFLNTIYSSELTLF